MGFYRVFYVFSCPPWACFLFFTWVFGFDLLGPFKTFECFLLFLEGVSFFEWCSCC